MTLLVLATPARAEDDSEWSWLDNDYYQVALNVRARIELADFDGLEQSEAYTIRALLGIGSKPYRGLSGYAELESSLSLDDSQYFDVVEDNSNGLTPIADPEETDLNQLYLRYSKPDLYGLDLVGGRQRIKLDDDRFIGNVGWRQNEQTYDAAQASTSFGVPGLKLTYGYIWEVLRIFGDDGSPAMHDFDSESHLVRLGLTEAIPVDLALFAYLLDFDNSPVNSANSYGLRATGTSNIRESWSVDYAGSYAVQTDAGDNPVDYTAHYVAAEGTLQRAGLGGLGFGYELLSSDDGEARFVTPLATAHAFNGFADVFTDNGGVNGLQDLYVTLTPAWPGEIGAKLKSKIIYHHFWSDEGGDSLGDEIDYVVTYPINEHWSVLSKGAYFDGTGDGPADAWRWWLEATFAL